MNRRTKEHLTSTLLRKGGADSAHSICHALTPSDWEELLNKAKRHSLLPLLFSQLKTLNLLSDIPNHLQQELQEIYRKSAARGLHLSIELTRILAHFKKRNIFVIVLKGPHLAEVFYQDWAVRPMCDFDFLVRTTDLGQASEALKDLGYQPSKEINIKAQISIHSHLPLFSKKERFFTELHWTLEEPISPFKIDLEGVWKRARNENIVGVDTLVLSNEDLLLYLCIHAAYRHRFTFGLLPFCDISETLESLKDQIDWRTLKMLSEQWDASRCVFLTLYLAKELIGAEVPRNFLKSLEPADFDPFISELARERILNLTEDSLPMNHNISQLWGNQTLWSRGMIFMRKTFPSVQFLSAMYAVDPSSKRIYFYYVVRLKDLLSRYGKTVIALLKKDKAAIAQVHREEHGNMIVDWLTSR